jgi:hypothetical protein
MCVIGLDVAENCYLYLAAISGVCYCNAYVWLNVGVSVADFGGSENFSGGSNSRFIMEVPETFSEVPNFVTR